ncbi:MAG: thiamine pyrophosphate-binding protein [Gammaproteobacteria bacterium]|nr:thiamine pyrophosphate-binding protein [Gammaproteobacteria bacterium]MYD77244.1 thiamine pyrophosphate-binding protein [Gammaproteobacteria bacterium]MYJ52404.1 thiamine pyrophosphate-binding protein [Gammaproteobacteria bacterium]
MRSGGEILVDGLIGHGARHIFCVPGESYLPALDACYDRQDSIRLITCRHEGGAAYMAEAYGKISGTPGICFVSRGPGASNAMIGIHTAFQDSTPLLLLVGQVPREETGREAFQELDYRQIYPGVAKTVVRINHPERIPELLGQAWRHAVSGRPGPVVVELPEDVLGLEAAVNDLAPLAIENPAPKPEAIGKLDGILKTAEQPVLLVGGAGWTPDATRSLTEFAEKHRLPVVTAFRRSDCFDNTHPNYAGELGLGPNPRLIEKVRMSDLLIAVGPRIGDMTTSGYSVLVPPERPNCNPLQKLVHVHVDAHEIGRVYAADLGIVSGPDAFFRSALALDAAERVQPEWRDELHGIYLDWLTLDRNVGEAVRMDRIMAHLREVLPEDAVITVGAGSFSIWGQRNYRFRRPGTFLGSTNGSMGYGVPSAISAKLLRPEATVVSFSGDGCFLMNGQELATAVQYDLGVVFLIVNNNRYGTIRVHQERHYPDRVSGTDLRNPDFVALARAYGAHGQRVTETGEFADAFERALGTGGPSVIELMIDY